MEDNKQSLIRLRVEKLPANIHSDIHHIAYHKGQSAKNCIKPWVKQIIALYPEDYKRPISTDPCHQRDYTLDVHYTSPETKQQLQNIANHLKIPVGSLIKAHLPLLIQEIQVPPKIDEDE